MGGFGGKRGKGKWCNCITISTFWKLATVEGFWTHSSQNLVRNKRLVSPRSLWRAHLCCMAWCPCSLAWFWAHNACTAWTACTAAPVWEPELPELRCETCSVLLCVVPRPPRTVMMFTENRLIVFPVVILPLVENSVFRLCGVRQAPPS